MVFFFVSFSDKFVWLTDFGKSKQFSGNFEAKDDFDVVAVGTGLPIGDFIGEFIGNFIGVVGTGLPIGDFIGDFVGKFLGVVGNAL